MLDGFGSIFDTTGFVPRFDCGVWTQRHAWTHICGDLAIFLAYAAIPISLAILVVKRGKQLPFGGVIWLFVAFIASCGLTHLVESVLFFEPVYRLSAAMKVVTAIVSWATVFALLKVVPGVLALPELQAENARLRVSHDEKIQQTQVLSRTREELEARNLTLAKQRLITEQACRSAQVALWRFNPAGETLDLDAGDLAQTLIDAGSLPKESQETFLEELTSQVRLFAQSTGVGGSGRVQEPIHLSVGPGLTVIGCRLYPKAEDARLSGVVIQL